MVENRTYDLIRTLEEQNLFKKLLGKGLVSVKFLNDKEMYESYLQYIDEGFAKMEAYGFTASDFNCSRKTVERVVIKMES